MDVIVDIQCVKNHKNVFIPKEVAIVAIDGDYSAHWMIAPSKSIDSFTYEIKKENNWLKTHKHGLDHFEGEVPLNSLNKVLKELTNKVNRIFVRGREKYAILQKLTSTEVINLEYDNDCPSFDNLPWCDTYCIQHALKLLHLHYCCALNNAHRLKSWLKNQEKYFYHEQMDFSGLIEIVSDNNKEIGKNEHERDMEKIIANPSAYSRSVSGGSEPKGVDETDSFHSQHG